MTTCPSCGIAGNNFSCPNHAYWGINPLHDLVFRTPEQPAWSSLYAEIGRLNVLLNERDKEIERLRVLMPPDDTSFLGKAWSLIAEKLRLERDALSEEVAEKDKEIERLKSLMPPDERGPGFVGQGSWSVFAEKVVAERDAAMEKVVELKECLRWYVQNDETQEGGMWEEPNGFWLRGKRRAMRALGMEGK